MAIELNVIIENEESFKKFNDAVKEGVSLLEQIDSLKEQIKDIANDLKEEFDLATKDYNTTIKHVYKNSIDEELEYLSLIESAVNKINNKEG